MSTSSLSLGTHTVTYAYTDTGGRQGVDSVSLTVGHSITNPVAQIISPSDGLVADPGASITLTGTGFDAEDGAVSASAIWSSSIDGSLGSGASLTTTLPSNGTHTITLTVRDSAGRVGTDTVTVVVRNPAGNYTLLAIADAHDKGGSSTSTNYGSETTLRIRKSEDSRVFVKFDVAPYAGTVTSATFRITCAATQTPPDNLSLYEMSSSWNEMGITHSNKPTRRNLITTITANETNGTVQTFDVTNYVAAQKANGNVSFWLDLAAVSEGDNFVRMRSRETTSPPQLVISTEAAEPPDAFASWQSAIAWNGADSHFSSDPDGDGIVNLLEYALSHNPLEAQASPYDQFGMQGSHLEITFKRIADPDLVYSVEGSSDLQNWTSFWSSTGPSNSPGPVTVADPSSSTGSPRFLRVRITR